MEIICPPTLVSSLKNKHLIVDANVIRDSVGSPKIYGDFFIDLKKSDITIVTIDLVKYELLKGSSNSDKYKAREKQISNIVDITLPIPSNINKNIYKLIENYGIEGSSLSVTDLYLGSMLMQYKENIYLMTRDTTDFIQNIFDLKFIINARQNKGIFTYGVYQYLKQ